MRSASRTFVYLLGALIAFGALLVPVAPIAPLSAQVVGEEVAGMIASLRPGERVRLLAPGISIQDGVVVSASVELLSVLEESQRWEVTPQAVERLAVRERGTTRVLINGALFGAAAGFAMGYFYNKALCDTGGGCGNRVVISAGVVGTLLGGGGGAAIGYRAVTWRQRFP